MCKKLSPIAFLFIPSLAIIPIFLKIASDFHFGGLSLVYSFFLSALQPSLNSTVVLGSLRGLLVTLSIALVSSSISLTLGLFLGIFSSTHLWNCSNFPTYIANIIRTIFAIPRSIHEIIWGLFLLQIFGISSSIAITAISIPYSFLVARVVSDQIDSLNINSLTALRVSGVKALPAFLSCFIPSIAKFLLTYSTYILECTLRGATILGIFGLGGIGTELQLTIQSLQFNEMWTSLFILWFFITFLEQTLFKFRLEFKSSFELKIVYQYLFIVLTCPFLLGLLILFVLNIPVFDNIYFSSIGIPNILDVFNSFNPYYLANLILTTLTITFLATGISIGLPPLLISIFPYKNVLTAQTYLWSLLRVIPPPLTAMILMFIAGPSLAIASLALGIYNFGIMARFLNDNIKAQDKLVYTSLRVVGISHRLSWIYGLLSLRYKNYLAYSAYRADVILRETAMMGIVGGVGLGWQLKESLSSFNWSEVFLILIIYTLLTIIGENITAKIRSYWVEPVQQNASTFSP